MGGESLIFEAAIGYCCLLIVVGQESAPSPYLKPPLKPNQQQELEGIQQLSLRFFLVRTVSMHYLMSV